MKNLARRLAEIPVGNWTKWLVVGFWVVAVAYPLAGKLTHAEKDDASAWLPASAESVKVLDVQTRLQPPNTYPAVVVYYRASALGFAVAFGILLDTIIVRSVLVTALNLDVGRWMSWPSRLARTPDPAPAELSHERASALAGV